MSFEHLLLLGLIVLILGPKRLPELGHSLGKFVRDFKDSISGVEEASFRKIDATGNKQEKPIAQAQGTAPSNPPNQPTTESEKPDPGKTGTT